jgi:hypothetical protein
MMEVMEFCATIEWNQLHGAEWEVVATFHSQGEAIRIMGDEMINCKVHNIEI